MLSKLKEGKEEVKKTEEEASNSSNYYLILTLLIVFVVGFLLFCLYLYFKTGPINTNVPPGAEIEGTALSQFYNPSTIASERSIF